MPSNALRSAGLCCRNLAFKGGYSALRASYLSSKHEIDLENYQGLSNTVIEFLQAEDFRGGI